ncbi:bile acid:sodium symporter [Streptomyces sp. NA04227]|uniref:bile acid:sodium symporter family protein n=1 Tax=Streptomyces sp. NA04227 TaxID=2742136 RepID=UPI001592795F|nr:bile acid:sodium symporter family protein [Streptomyces sp. NA04227]QKW07914.1 bile acid:sodium symporter [Streptomyces sp. NA04227]
MTGGAVDDELGKRGGEDPTPLAGKAVAAPGQDDGLPRRSVPGSLGARLGARLRSTLGNPLGNSLGKAVSGLRRVVDPYVAALFGTVVLAALLPASGGPAAVVDHASAVAIGLLFFLYGVRLSTKETLAGLRNVRLHLLVLGFTFVFFPLLGLAAAGLVPSLLSPDLHTGVLFLCVVPSTVQSSVALASLARGDVPAAICAGTYSSLIGLALTPLLTAWLIGPSTGLSTDGLLRIAGQLLAPFLAGQLLRPWLGGFVARHKRVLGPVDRVSILLVVYTAFSEGMNQGVWSQITPPRMLALFLVLALLLTLALGSTHAAARMAGLPHEQRITTILCGSQKSLANGLPMAAVLFGRDAALAVLPLMLYHQLQLMVCAGMARRWGRTGDGGGVEREDEEQVEEGEEGAPGEGVGGERAVAADRAG